MKKFQLVDWSWYIYRAYYALPELNDQNWNNINALYGFFRMILKLLQDRPDYFLIALDSPQKTIRHEKYIDYKANRKKMDDNFRYQVWIIKKSLIDIWINSLEFPWFEADDIINSFVKNISENQDVNSIVISCDKDLKQLIWEKTIFFDPLKEIYVTKENFIVQYWYEPIYIIDYLCIVWDSTDNIKWVPWIWEKTWKILISQYWSIDNIYKNIDFINDKIKNKLIDYKKEVYQNQELVKLYYIDLFDNLKINEYTVNIDFDKLHKKLVEEYNFKSFEKILKDLQKKFSIWIQNSLF